MYLVLLFKLEGLLTFYFYRAQKKREREPFAHQVPKKTLEPPSRGPLPEAAASRGVGRGPPGSWHTPSPAPPARWRPGLQDQLLINSDKINSGQSVSGERAGQSFGCGWAWAARRQQEEQNGDFPKTRGGPAKS